MYQRLKNQWCDSPTIVVDNEQSLGHIKLTFYFGRIFLSNLLIFQNGVLSPIEIKKAASPGKTAIKNFNVLEPVTREGSFGGLESLKVEIGTGSVICMANDLLPVDEKNWYVPVWLI